MKCLNCGADVPVGRLVYCSDHCRKQALQKRWRKKRGIEIPAEATCRICGKVFKPKCKTAKYCSDECRYEAGKQRCKLFYFNRSTPVVKSAVKCARCGKEFTPKSSTQKYCSTSCGKAANNAKASANLREQKERAAREALTNETPKPGKSLAEWCKEAAECNLDYGTYRALITSGKTFEELKAQADSRCVQIHAHGRVHKGGWSGNEHPHA